MNTAGVLYWTTQNCDAGQHFLWHSLHTFAVVWYILHLIVKLNIFAKIITQYYFSAVDENLPFSRGCWILDKIGKGGGARSFDFQFII